MKLAAREDVDRPIEDVFRTLTDVPAFERAAVRRRARIERKGVGPKFLPGQAWDVRFPFRGRERRIELRVASVDGPRGFALEGVSQNLDLTVAVALIALSRSRTRVSVDAEFKPRTLAARLVVQSLRLTKGRLQKRIGDRLSTYLRSA